MLTFNFISNQRFSDIVNQQHSTNHLVGKLNVSVYQLRRVEFFVLFTPVQIVIECETILITAV